jgi:3-hydroxymyristoyl/3-hydroxydecanoyl-(acyl carrier protein) dehydratase
MDGRFRAFSFVDRITRLDPGRRIEGHYTVPPDGTRFPPALMAEAVGQLAAWAAMSQVRFAQRPVAGLAGETRYHGSALPGRTLQLVADIERCDADAVAYGGTASIDGHRVLELANCVGPMLPMDEFDDPAAVRADFATLVERGAPAGRFGGVDAPLLTPTQHSPGTRASALLEVPTAAAYFADHFPRRPVFPGTLLMDALSTLALQLARELPSLREGPAAVTRVRDVKLRSFTAPGRSLELTAEVASAPADGVELKVSARGDGRTVATARVDVMRSR